MKILLLDIERAPVVATIWTLWDLRVSTDQLIGDSYILTWAAKWFGEREMKDGSLLRDGKRKMLSNMQKLLDEADAVVTWNGDKFDLKVLSKEFLVAGLKPPSPQKSVDLMQVAKRRFMFTSNKMDHVAHMLGVGRKKKHRGHQMWLDCMARKASAFVEMLRYNRKDVTLLEKLYVHFLPWITNHPNRSAYSERPVCTNCGVEGAAKRGFTLTRQSKYQRYQCYNCGSWFRGSKPVATYKGERMVAIV